MRATSHGFAFALFGLFAACSGETGSDHDHGAGGAKAGAAGAAGKGGTKGTAGTTSSSGGSGAISGTSGASNSGGTSGSAGAPNNQGGTAGHTGVAGATGNSGGRAGAANQAGAPAAGGAPGGGGAPNAGTTGEAGASNEAGAAGQNTSGASGGPNEPLGLSWPIDCIPNQTCVNLGYPDIDEDGVAHDCGEPAYFGHQGTDIGITLEAEAAGTAVRAAADGVVLFAFDGKYDQCPNANEPDCQAPPSEEPGGTNGNTVCTPIGPYCGTGEPGCYWCFAAGNVLVIRHADIPGVFATRYDHLKKNSLRVQPGDTVTRGQKIAEAASAGNSTGPHLHFEVWGTGFYELADPWSGPCGPNTGPTLWAYDPPWSG